ncbi:MAG TPA: S-methyl-5'-thioadenosine phosphorylase, partial [Ktedonobacterales bacterium]
VTDYDVWHESAESVTVEMVVANLTRNVENAKRIIRAVSASMPATRAGQTCGCEQALANAVMTDRSRISAPLRAKYGLLLGKYLEN